MPNLLTPLEEEPTEVNLLSPLPPRRYLQDAQPRYQDSSGFSGLSFTGELPEINELATTLKTTRRQNIAERAAKTETRGNVRDFAQQGRLDDFLSYQKETTENTWQTLTDPVFDILSVFNYPMAGAAKEFLRTGSGWNAFKQAASEFANILPGIDEEDVVKMGLPEPERTTFADVLRETDLFDDEGHGRWSSAVGGLVLDIMTDPFTYTGYGTIFNAVKGLKKYETIANTLKKAEARGDRLREIKLLGNAADSFTRKFITQGGVKSLERRLLKGKTSFEGIEMSPFKTPEGLEETPGVLGKLKGTTGATDFRTNAREMKIAQEYGLKEVDELAKEMVTGLNMNELHMMGAYLSDPQLFRNQLMESVKAGLVPEDQVEFIIQKRDAFKRGFDKYFEEEVARDIISRGSHHENYMSGITARTRESKALNKQAMEEAGRRQTTKDKEAFGTQFYQSAENPGFRMERTYDTLMEAVQEGGYSREFNIGVNFLDRGFHHVKAVVWDDFMKKNLNNPAISQKITGKLSKDAEKAFADKGYGIWTRKVMDVEAQYLMPKEIVSELEHMRSVYSSPSEVQDLLKAFDWFNNTWKGWAVMSPGFHMRNMFSNYYLNWMGDVGNNQDDYSNVPKFIRNTVNKAMGKEVPRVAGMTRLSGAAYQIIMGTALEDASSETVQTLLKSFGAKNVKELKSLIPDIVGKDGKVLDMQGIIDEINTTGLRGSGFFGDFNQDLQQQISRNSLTPKKYIERDAPPLYDAVETKLNDGASQWEFDMDGKMVGRVRLQGNKIRDIVADSPEKAKEYLSDILVKKTKRLPTDESLQSMEIFEGVGGLTREALEDLGFVTGEGVDYAGKALMRWDEKAAGGLKNFTRQIFQQRESSKALDFAKKAFGPTNPMTKANRALGGMVEDHAKVMHYLDRRIKGFSPEDAATSAKKWLYDYGELTDFERRYMKRVLPFYAWMRHNSVNMMRSIVMNPGKFARTSKFINGIESLSTEWDNIQTPDYYDELRAIRLPWAREGKPVYLNPNLPFQGINQMNWKDAVSSLNPLIKGAFEGMPDRGYNTFLDRPIEEYEGEPSVSPVFKAMGLSKMQEHRIKALAPLISKTARLAEKYEQGELLEQIATEFGGVKLIPYDRRRHTRGLTFAWRQASRDYKQKLSDE